MKKTVCAAALCILLFTAAGYSQKKAKDASAPIKVIDQNNMEVTIPKKPERIVLTALPLPSIYALTGEPIEKLVGMHPGSTSAIKNSVMSVMFPQLLKVPSNFINGTDINIEELMKLRPDAVMYWAEYMNQYELFKSAGIPAVGVKTQGGGDVIVTMESWLTLMGDMFGKSKKVDAVLAFGKQIQKDILTKVEKIPADKKPKVLYVFNHSSDSISVSGNGFYGGNWIENTGGINAAREIQGHSIVNMEQIYKWNPDIIILTTFTATMPEDLYENKIRGQNWSNVKAVKNKKVYKEPLGVYRWFPPSGDAPLMSMWMANLMQGDVFKYDMKKEIKDYYKKFYQYELTDEQVNGILSANPEAAKGAGFGGKH
ncbi:ABC transporter substrate-binding protein [Treponema sp. OMZ 840]|uniref:ABC transporter substrate-binding protein n=1 Tax=Treponema sp. OMZ 840 TaxID=244313 RepID=UPI003D8AC89D